MDVWVWRLVLWLLRTQWKRIVKEIFIQYFWRILLLILLSGVSSVGCGGGIPMTSDEARQDWEKFEAYTMVATIDHQIESELAGKPVPGGVESWNTHWLLRIKHMHDDLEKNQKYIDYIIRRRSEDGLPSLKGYLP